MSDSPSTEIGLDGFVRDRAPADAVGSILEMIERHATGILEFHGIPAPFNAPVDSPREAHFAISALRHGACSSCCASAGNVTDVLLQAMLMVASADQMYSS